MPTSLDPLFLLDIGCGSGHFLEVCEKENILAHGLDIYEGMIEKLKDKIAENRLHEVSDIIDFDITDNFGVITLWGVLEHLTEPHQIFRKCSDLLIDGGLILALIPNISSRAMRLLGISTPTLNPRQHINFFSKDSMQLVSSKAGFKIVEIFNELPVIDLMWDYIDGSDKKIIEDIVYLNESYYHVYILKKSKSK